MGSAWRIGVREDERTQLVTGGPFTVVRNPIFSCMLLTATGLVVLLPNVLSVAALACLLAAVELQVRFVEEPYLLHTHGQCYRDYASRVGRFFPGFGRLDQDAHFTHLPRPNASTETCMRRFLGHHVAPG